DDFGSGLSSFGYLQNLPVDVLKIDGDFIREMDQDPIRQAMVKSIHEVGHVMGMSTVAEWIENERVLGLVRSLNITYAQGFYIHRPEPVREVDDSAVS
ncbi:MAG: EAL domain-containing protein, partial [Acidobacteriota bacterium]